MKRLAGAAVAAAIAAAVLAAWTLAAPANGPAGHAAAAKVRFPPLPANIKSRHRWLIGVKCDFPPFGFIDVRGNHDGYDVQIARRLHAGSL